MHEPGSIARLIDLIITGVMLAMLSFINTLFHGMVDSVIAFHQKHNAANVHRFPVSVLVEHRALFKRGATMLWLLGSSSMFYGVWTGTRV
jgi:hypothetical protein